MSNLNTPYGLRPVRHLSGGCIRNNAYALKSLTAQNIFAGDPVEIDTDAGFIQLANGDGDAPVGVFAGCSYTDATGKPVFSPFWPAGIAATNIQALVYDDPDIVYSMKSDGTTATTAASVGVAYNSTIVAGDASVGRSKTVLKPGGTTTPAFMVKGLVNKPDNEWGLYSEVEVLIVRHKLLADS